MKRARGIGSKKKKAVMAKLYTLDYNEELERYRIGIEKVPEADVPKDAVHVTGEKGAWFLDRSKAGDFPTGPNAIDLNLYMVNNSINDALALQWSGMKNMDMRRIITIGIVAIVGVCIVWAMWPM